MECILYIENPSIELVKSAFSNKALDYQMYDYIITDVPKMFEQFFSNNTDAIKSAAVDVYPLAIVFMDQSFINSHKDIVKKVLTNEKLIRTKRLYDSVVRLIFKSNAILIKRWRDYGDDIR